jgi:hypothetical protein
MEDLKEEFPEVIPKFDPNQELDKDMILVKMTRGNYRYDVSGYTFTKDHPFVAMNPDVAQEIFDKEEGFRLATPREVQEYYN